MKGRDGTVIADQSPVGMMLPAFSTDVERGQLRFFAQAIGENDPAYIDVAAARDAGHRDLPVPPTFLFSLELQRPDPYGVLRELEVDLRWVLHGEQRFTYHAMAYAGDRLDLTPRISDYYEKKGGALRFLVRDTCVARAGSPIAELRNVLVIREPEGAA